MIETLADDSGVLLRSELLDAGFDDNWIRRQRRAGLLVRMRQGAYALAHVWERADPVARHLLLVRAVLRQYSDGVAASHASAVLLHGGPSWRLPLDAVDLTHLDRTIERNAAAVRHHRGDCRAGDVTRVDACWVTSPLRTAMDTANLLTRDPAVAVLDHFLHSGLVTEDELRARLREGMRRWPRTLHLYRTLELVDPRCESVGETRTRLLIHDAGLPPPVSQYEVRHPSGLLAGRVDFAWPEHGLLLEFDGRQKYLALRRPGESIEQAVLREKAREDLLRELTGFRVIRITWADLEDPARTIERIRRALLGLAA